MKECEEEEKELLIPLVKILKYQECCEWILKKDMKDSCLVLCKNGLCWYHEGVVEKSHSVVIELSMNRVIEVVVDSHELLKVNGEDVSEMEHSQVLNLSDDGERWEGNVLHDQPYGWGVLYDSEGEKVYEGFRLIEVNMCYGTQCYSDIQKVEYEGEWCDGKRWGRGVQFDRKGDLMFDGEWVNDEQLSKRVVLSEENQFLHNRIEELIVIDESCNGREWTAFDFSLLIKLRELKMGCECLKNVEEVKLIGLNQLERVVIGGKSFRRGDDYNPDRHFYLKNCERLKELKIGRFSFSDYSVCEIENVPSLEVIEMGELNEVSCNFKYASLELKSDSKEKELMNRHAQFEISFAWQLCISYLLSCSV